MRTMSRVSAFVTSTVLTTRPSRITVAAAAISRISFMRWLT